MFSILTEFEIHSKRGAQTTTLGMPWEYKKSCKQKYEKNELSIAWEYAIHSISFLSEIDCLDQKNRLILVISIKLISAVIKWDFKNYTIANEENSKIVTSSLPNEFVLNINGLLQMLWNVFISF
jgi:hypothetical protein